MGGETIVSTGEEAADTSAVKEEDIEGTSTLTATDEPDGDAGKKKASEDKADHKEGDTDEKSEDSKADKDKDGAPETYADFDVPDTMQVDEAKLGKFTEVMKTLGATQEQAQELVNMQTELVSEFVETQQKAWADTRKAWVDAGQTDEEYGKGKYDESMATARFAMRELGGLPLAKALEETGMGDHPEFLRLFFRVGSMMKEDNITFGSATKPAPKTHAERLYPNQGKA